MTDHDNPQDDPLTSEDLIARARDGMASHTPSMPPVLDEPHEEHERESDFIDALESHITPEPEPEPEPTLLEDPPPATVGTWQPPTMSQTPEDSAPSPWAPPSGGPVGTESPQSVDSTTPAPIARPSDSIPSQPPPAARRRNIRPLIVVGAVVAALGWGLFNADTSIEDVVVGDCFNNPDVEEVTSIKTISCEEAHDYEVMQIFVYAGGDEAPYPGEDDLWQTAVDGCIPDFQQYTGLVWENETELFIDAFYPLPKSWDAGDREAWCLLVRLNPDTFEVVPQTGSLRSS
ncbi:hypothetical protein MNBD_ACTINO02-1239 [hydrothermal vent metagenome]|uniref:Septum formation-related domain-containing protein n=1 Tax=hydrothermal vent metagenome TaxID=652676 RepID=A0A3B0RYY4_9ZZZZ